MKLYSATETLRLAMNLRTAICFQLIAFACLSTCAPITEREKYVIKYLQSSGHLPRRHMREITHEEVENALREFQKAKNVEATGKINNDTFDLMRTFRCGADDTEGHRQKRYALLSTKWDKNHLTWKFINKNPKFHRYAPKIRNLIAEATVLWSEHSVLTFEEALGYEPADLEISFEPENHDSVDRYPLDQDNLAHAFSAGLGLGGDIHFRDTIEWDFDVSRGDLPNGDKRSFFAVLLHEMGHSLGLDHSLDHPEAVMYDTVHESTGVLKSDDIAGIQHIYGIPRSKLLTTEKPIETTLAVDEDKMPDKCDIRYDAISIIQGELSIFNGLYVWRPEVQTEAIKIRSIWPALPENMTKVDSVYEAEDGKTWIFIGRNIYAFSGDKLAYESSLTILGISHEFKKIDAIFKWPHNKKTYIFSGDSYWRLDGDEVSKSYPIPILSSWREVYDIDTALGYEGKLYFFKGKYYYEFDIKRMKINRMRPLPTASKFMKCVEKPPKVYISNRFDPVRIDVIDRWQDEIDSIDCLPNAETNCSSSTTPPVDKKGSAGINKFSSFLFAFVVVVPLLMTS